MLDTSSTYVRGEENLGVCHEMFVIASHAVFYCARSLVQNSSRIIGHSCSRNVAATDLHVLCDY